MKVVYYDYWIQLQDVRRKDPILNGCHVLHFWRSEILYAFTKDPKSIEPLPPRPALVSCNAPKHKNPNGYITVVEKCPCGSGTMNPWAMKLAEPRAAISKFSSAAFGE